MKISDLQNKTHQLKEGILDSLLGSITGQQGNVQRNQQIEELVKLFRKESAFQKVKNISADFIKNFLATKAAQNGVQKTYLTNQVNSYLDRKYPNNSSIIPTTDLKNIFDMAVRSIYLNPTMPINASNSTTGINITGPTREPTLGNLDSLGSINGRRREPTLGNLDSTPIGSTTGSPSSDTTTSSTSLNVDRNKLANSIKAVVGRESDKNIENYLDAMRSQGYREGDPVVNVLNNEIILRRMANIRSGGGSTAQTGLGQTNATPTNLQNAINLLLANRNLISQPQQKSLEQLINSLKLVVEKQT